MKAMKKITMLNCLERFISYARTCSMLKLYRFRLNNRRSTMYAFLSPPHTPAPTQWNIQLQSVLTFYIAVVIGIVIPET